ncbi:Uncharacterised protein [Listeria newyorkensis]|nr:Uncharacterised protein [Listeria newyorkensis]
MIYKQLIDVGYKINEIDNLDIDDIALLANISTINEEGYGKDDVVPFDVAFPMFF